MNIPDFKLPEIFANYVKKDFIKTSQQLIDIIRHFNERCYVRFSRDEKRYFDDCIWLFFYIFTQPDFQVPAEYAGIFININHIIANVAAISTFGSTEPMLKRVYTQNDNYVKILTLATCQVHLEADMGELFKPNPDLTSLWWLNYQTGATGTFTQETYDRVVNQLKKIPEGFSLQDFRTSPLYFQSTYYSPETDHLIKQELNKHVRIKLSGAKIHNCPKPKSIAIITDRWQPTTAVYKSCYKCIEALSKRYDLTLVQYSDKHEETDTKLFKQIKYVKIHPDLRRLDFSEIKHNDFQMAYFPDIGMNYESVCLSNMQVAPIMATSYGHPVSTFGSKIDYFIGGQDSEIIELAEKNYSERLVLIPGIGSHPVFPNYVRKYPKPDKFIINCCATAPKLNYPFLSMLREIQQKASLRIHFQFFPSWTISRYQSAIPFLNNIDKFFKGAATVYFDTPYQQYLELLENGQFTVDSYPFGGYNTIVDALFVGCPVVTLEGTRFFNRASSALMRKVNLTHLITTNRVDYVEKALELVDNPSLLKATRDAVTATDLKALLIDTEEPTYFANAIEYLINHHTELKQTKDRKPLLLA